MANFKGVISTIITKKFNTRLSNSISSLTRNFSNSSILKSQEYYLARSPKGANYRLHLAKSRHLVGIRTTRGTREYNEDRYQAMVLELSDNKTKRDDVIVNQPILDDKNIENEELEGKFGQICYFALFDGHGGAQCADHLTANLHKQIESVEASDADGIVTEFRNIGGYFRRFKPPVLETLLSPEVADITPKKRPNNQKSGRESLRKFSSSTPSPTMLTQTLPLQTAPTVTTQSLSSHSNLSTKPLTLEQRLTLAYLKIDIELMSVVEYNSIGSTASAALIKSLDKRPFWTSNDIEITIAHVGDTRILLCDAENGNSIQLTFDHHPGSISEVERLSKSGGFIITDSFGAEMYLGSLANTRSLGDARMKRFGISAEPEISIHHMVGKKFAFMVLVSDGITSVLSNQEIVDYLKDCDNPTIGASKLVDLADELGSNDNMTAMVIRLPGWGTSMPDHTKELRKYRLDQNFTSRRR
ncbi:13636_t:CDS:2 [Funneliformis geosporum]|uniref:10456_t:CDS:1 n=1 Tax=Funneliformis geosporum TaxID=1117311 RepID=A0A9W4SNY4_9GLOM|nr:10456_t:CDS:2 [Funneliformis geosporum]CAI2179775.1 13636_t:CDS:2 [Funneliformis geosporum]